MADQDTLDQFVAARAGDDKLTKEEQVDIAKKAKSLKDVNVNLAYARMAVSVVRKQVTLVANWNERVDTSAEGIYRIAIAQAEAQFTRDQARATSQADLVRAEERYQAAAARAEAASKAAWDRADRCVYGAVRTDAEWVRINAQVGGVQSLNDIQVLAGLAHHHGCGNCGELTAKTFMYLYHLGARPLDFMALRAPADHAFVVIGRGGSPADDNVGRNWGKAAVICDPWATGVIIPLPAGVQGPLDTFGDAYAAYPATLLEQKMKAMHPTFTGVSLSHREV